jgi:polyhydroxyalkanoate synthesis regulator phasin
MTKKQTTKKAKATKVTVDAKGVFLATLGLYGKIYEQGSERVTEVNNKRQELFKELVARGEKLEGQAKQKIEELKSANPALETRIDAMRGNINKLKDKYAKQAQTSNAKAATV